MTTQRRAWGWVTHLREGGTTPWLAWVQDGDERGRVLPGAQQLELLRRLNQTGRPSTVLVERVLGASAPGRGRPDLELLGAAEPSRFGPPPVDPAGLRDDELLRVAASLIAEDLVGEGARAATPAGTTSATTVGSSGRRAPGLVRPWRTRYRIVGDPWLADPIRAELIARGRPPGGRGSVVLVMGTDLATMLVDAWTSRAFAEGGPGWTEWLDALVARHQVAPRVDLAQAARVWSGRVGPDRVRIVLDPAAVPRLVGVRRALPVPPTISADGVDLARRVASVLGLLVAPQRREQLLGEVLRPRLVHAAGGLLVVPPEHGEWVHLRAGRMRDALLRAGYPVHGDLDTLLGPVGPASAAAGHPNGAGAPCETGVLRLAMGLMMSAEESGEVIT